MSGPVDCPCELAVEDAAALVLDIADVAYSPFISQNFYRTGQSILHAAILADFATL
jgi:hypothetical protein